MTSRIMADSARKKNPFMPARGAGMKGLGVIAR
jgi:hypothetical protein